MRVDSTPFKAEQYVPSAEERLQDKKYTLPVVGWLVPVLCIGRI